MNASFYLWIVLVLSLAALAALAFKHLGLRRVRDVLLREKDVAYNFVHDVGNIFGDVRTINTDKLLERVLFYAQNTTRAAAGVLYLIEPDGTTLRARAVAGPCPPLAGSLPPDIENAKNRLPLIEKAVREQPARFGEGIVGAVAAGGNSMLIRNPELDARIPHPSLDFLRIHSILLVPMRFHNATIGVLAVVNRVDGEPFTETDRQLLESMADQASVTIYYMQQSAALDEKRQMDRDLSIAREIQTALIPQHIPLIPGANTAAFYEPARGIGGDYYDFIAIDDSHVGIVVADVSGKGISGAIVMAICRSIVRTHATGNHSPAAVLRAVNAAMATDLSEGIFITALYAVLDTSAMELTVARAGHLPPMICRGDRDGYSILESEGVAIGIAPPDIFESNLDERKLKLKAGDTVIMYTDGITEAQDRNGNEWTADSLAATVQSVLRQEGHASHVARSVKERLLDFVGNTPQYDDMTLVVLQVG